MAGTSGQQYNIAVPSLDTYLGAGSTSCPHNTEKAVASDAPEGHGLHPPGLFPGKNASPSSPHDYGMTATPKGAEGVPNSTGADLGSHEMEAPFSFVGVDKLFYNGTTTSGSDTNLYIRVPASENEAGVSSGSEFWVSVAWDQILPKVLEMPVIFNEILNQINAQVDLRGRALSVCGATGPTKTNAASGDLSANGDAGVRDQNSNTDNFADSAIDSAAFGQFSGVPGAVTQTLSFAGPASASYGDNAGFQVSDQSGIGMIASSWLPQSQQQIQQQQMQQQQIQQQQIQQQQIQQQQLQQQQLQQQSQQQSQASHGFHPGSVPPQTWFSSAAQPGSSNYSQPSFGPTPIPASYMGGVPNLPTYQQPAQQPPMWNSPYAGNGTPPPWRPFPRPLINEHNCRPGTIPHTPTWAELLQRRVMALELEQVRQGRVLGLLYAERAEPRPWGTAPIPIVPHPWTVSDMLILMQQQQERRQRQEAQGGQGSRGLYSNKEGAPAQAWKTSSAGSSAVPLHVPPPSSSSSKGAEVLLRRRAEDQFVKKLSWSPAERSTVLIACSDTIYSSLQLDDDMWLNQKEHTYIGSEKSSRLYVYNSKAGEQTRLEDGHRVYIFKPQSMVLKWTRDGNLITPASLDPSKDYFERWLRIQVCHRTCRFRTGVSSLRTLKEIYEHFVHCRYLGLMHPLKSISRVELDLLTLKEAVDSAPKPEPVSPHSE